MLEAIFTSTSKLNYYNLLAWISLAIYLSHITPMSLPACGWARILSIYSNFASKEWLKKCQGSKSGTTNCWAAFTD